MFRFLRGVAWERQAARAGTSAGQTLIHCGCVTGETLAVKCKRERSLKGQMHPFDCVVPVCFRYALFVSQSISI